MKLYSVYQCTNGYVVMTGDDTLMGGKVNRWHVVHTREQLVALILELETARVQT